MEREKGMRSVYCERGTLNCTYTTLHFVYLFSFPFVVGTYPGSLGRIFVPICKNILPDDLHPLPLADFTINRIVSATTLGMCYIPRGSVAKLCGDVCIGSCVDVDLWQTQLIRHRRAAARRADTGIMRFRSRTLE